jgi:ribosomal protein S18 acetylase RimI-like enzyme
MIKYISTLQGLKPNDFNGFFVDWKKPLSVLQQINILKNSTYFILAYDTEKSRVVGFINALSDKVNFAFIPLLEVLPEYQNQGIGSNLLKKMLEKLKNYQCIDLTCDIEMQGFYEQFNMIKSHGMVIRKYL